MPQMGYDMQEGTVVRWLVAEGAEVDTGDAIAEIETDKAVVEFESTAPGLLRRILVPEGTTVPVGQTIAIVGDADEDIPEPEALEAVQPPEPEPEPQKENASIPLPPPLSQKPAESAASPRQQVRASPVARSIADERSIDLRQVKGTGPGGRITKGDVLSFDPSTAEPLPPEEPAPEVEEAPELEETPPAEHEPASEPAPVVAEAPPATAAPAETVPLSRMRQQIARVTVKSKQEIPHFYVSAEIDMSRAMELRQQINSSLEDAGVRVSVNDIMIKACVDALKAYPRFNAMYDDDGIHMNESINVGIAIAEEEGLIVPAILDCGGKTLAEIARASSDLIERSKGGTLHPQEYTGGTFTISNLGMFDVSSFTAIIHPPQSAVLAVGSVVERPVVRDGEIVVSRVMSATLSADHRVSDGAEGARFLVEIKRLLEEPLLLLV